MAATIHMVYICRKGVSVKKTVESDKRTSLKLKFQHDLPYPINLSLRRSVEFLKFFFKQDAAVERKPEIEEL